MLNKKQKRFVSEYVKTLNATEAAKKAQYSPKTAYSQGQRLLKHVEIKEEIRKRMADREKKTGVSADRVVLELARIAFADLKDIAKWGESGVTLKDSNTLKADISAAVAEVSQTRGKTSSLSIKQHNKLKALELLMRHLGMGKDIAPASDDKDSVMEGILGALK